jgi:hypothetical protein
MTEKTWHSNATGGPLVYEEPDELTQHELQQAITILRRIKSTQRGYLLASPTVGGGRALHIVHLDNAKAA